MGLNVRQHTAALQSILSDSISHFKEYCIISILYFHYEVKIEKKKLRFLSLNVFAVFGIGKILL